MSKKRRVIETLKTVLIVLLTGTALWLVVDSQLFGHLPGADTDRTEHTESVSTGESVSGRVTLPLAMAVVDREGCCGVQYDRTEVSALFDALRPLFGEALSGAGQPRSCTREEWLQSLSDGTGLWMDLGGSVPMSVLVRWVAGMENPALTAYTTHLLLYVDGDQAVRLYYQDAGDGQFYVSEVELVNPALLRSTLEEIPANGAAFAGQQPDYAVLQPQMLLAAQLPEPAEYTAVNPLSAPDEQERLETLLERLSFPVEITTVYDTPEGRRARAGNDTLTISQKGLVSYESTWEEGRYPVETAGEAGPEFGAVDGARRLVCGLLEPWCGAAGLYVSRVEPLSEDSWRVEFRYELDCIPTLVGSEGYAASVLVEQGYITQYDMQLRTFTPAGTQPTPVLAIKQAAAIVAQLDDAKGRFGLCYQDNGGVFRAGWVVE